MTITLRDFLVENPVIAAVRNESFASALDADCGMIFHLSANLLTLEEQIRAAHDKGKKLLLHMDLTEGIGRDKTAVRYLAKLGADGIISTHASLIRAAKDEGLIAVQRFFALDSQGVRGIGAYARQSQPDLLEILPGVALRVLQTLSQQGLDVIAGGLIETKADVTAALGAGALAVSTGNPKLWAL